MGCSEQAALFFIPFLHIVLVEFPDNSPAEAKND
jgi:hypothetical protein